MWFFKLIKVHFLVSELYIYQNALCDNEMKKYTYYQNTYTIVKTPKHYKPHTYTYTHTQTQTHTHTHINFGRGKNI